MKSGLDQMTFQKVRDTFNMEGWSPVQHIGNRQLKTFGSRVTECVMCSSKKKGHTQTKDVARVFVTDLVLIGLP